MITFESQAMLRSQITLLTEKVPRLSYAMKLFGGMIGWRANKQDTVTTSTTEAELLALSQTAKEALYVSRVLKELLISLDDSHIRIYRKCLNGGWTD
jgi:hypothetical protein